ncbi:MAG: M23 family metallopeptidase [Pseudoflavonifractor sp.]|nr:M23 family metallopeptidase [Pseudoflavonifractor sp.]
MSHNLIPGHSDGKRPMRFRTRRRYRLAFVNENTFNEVWTIKMTRSRVILSILLIMVAIGCVVTTLIVFTPVRTLLPGYLKRSQRQESVINNMRIDSLATEVEINNAYLANIHRILTDDIDTVTPVRAEAVTTMPVDSLAGASDAERQFVRNFEERERYNLSVLSPSAAGGLAFLSPLSGGAVSAQSDGAIGQSVIAPRGARVTAIYSGTVIESRYNPDGGYTVIIQHPDEFLSVLSGLAEVFVMKGDRVEAGAAVGMAGGTSRSGLPVTLGVELWRGGTPLLPSDYIPF